MPERVLLVNLSIVFGLLHSVNFLEPLLDHPQVLSVLHVQLDLIEQLEKAVAFLVDLSSVFNHLDVCRLS